LFYDPGSHRSPDFLYDGAFLSLHEAARVNGTNDFQEQVRRHQRALNDQGARYGLDRRKLTVKAGEVLIWHAALAHGGGPVSPVATRKSVVTHYCPRHHVPLYCEQHSVAFHDHDGHGYTSSHYGGSPSGV
jgi:ectoine hydroxylase-related dioxygenase (phytanoyl-CoA dioxygenase family)